MAIVHTDYRPKRAPRKRKRQTRPENMPLIVTRAPKKQLKGPVIRLKEQQQANDNGQEWPKRSAIVEPKRQNKTTTTFGNVPDDYDPEEHQRAGDKAQELFREIVRRAAAPNDDGC
jgi:hypothetical protein